MNLYSRLAHLARYQPEKPAVETRTGKWTFAELDLAARRVARLLRDNGVNAGDTIALRLRETPDHMAAFFAAMYIGAGILPLDWRGRQAEFNKIVARFPSKVLLTDDKLSLDWFSPALDVATASQRDPDTQSPAPVVDAVLIYGLTSGTTGAPKALTVTHENMLARTANRVVEGMTAADDVLVNTLPLAYTAGREHSLAAVLAGGTVVLFPTLFNPPEIVGFVNARRATVLNLSPNMSRAIVNAGAGGGEAVLMPGLRLLVSTTGKLEPHERTAVRHRLTPHLIDYYGSSGVGMIAAMRRPEDGVESTAAGHPIMGVQLEIADAVGAPVPAGEIGRVRIRGPAVSGANPGAGSDEVEGIHDGWYYPGDLGRIAPDGLLHLHGRAADLIKRGGLMVNAQEVEAVLAAFPGVVEAAVVGAPSESLGQEVVAFVAASAPLQTTEIVQHCRRELAPFKVPSKILLIERLPRNSSGKVVKAELLKQLQAGA